MEHRSPGRPPLVRGQPTEVVHLRLPADLHDAACRIALREGVSVLTVIRQAVSVYAANAAHFVSRNPIDE